MIKSAMADQEGKTKRYEADVTIAQSLRDKESRQAEFDAAVQAKQAEAEQAGPLATAIARQKVTEQETRIDQVRKQQEVLVQQQEAARSEQELQATVVKPAEAERQAAILRAEGEKQATVIRAEATQKELEFEGAGEAAKIERIGRAEAAKVLAVGEAEAEVIKKKLLAEAEGLQKKAEAWKNFNEAAVLNMVVDKMPELAQAFATQLAGIDKINIIEMGNGNGGSGGVGKVMGTVGGGMTAMLAMLKDQFGVDVARLMQAKTEAATAEAEKTKRRSPEMAGVYREHAAWNPERPDTTIITCVDGRWYSPLPGVRARASQRGARTDFLAVPGGIEPLTLVDLVPKDFNFFRRRLEALVESHGTRASSRSPTRTARGTRRASSGRSRSICANCKIRDLRRAPARLREMFHGVTVETYFARLGQTQPETVVFDAV